MVSVPLGVAGSDYQSGYAPVALQEAVNLYAEVQEARGRSEIAMLRTPGLASFSTVGASGTSRGGHTMAGVPYAVYGTTLYSVDSSGTETSIGSITGSDRCFFADNGTNLVIVADRKGWYYNASTTTFAQITDVDFGTPADVAYLDGYWLFPQVDSVQVQFNETANDPTSYNGTDFFSKSGDGSLLRRVFVNQRDMFLLGQRNTEVWRNAGNVDVPFIRQDGAEMERGCIAAHSVAELDNSFFFVGDDRVVYRVDGYTPLRVSNHAIEQWLGTLTESQITSAVGFTYTFRGHYFYALRADTQCMVYDVTASAKAGQALWHERASGAAADTIWRVNEVLDAHGKLLALDATENSMWSLDHANFTEDGVNMKWIRTCPAVFFEDKTVRHKKVELFVNSGIGGLGNEPEVAMQFSNDGGQTFSNNVYRRGIGDQGKYATRLIWRRQGQALNRIYRFSSTDDVDLALVDGRVDLEPLAR